MDYTTREMLQALEQRKPIHRFLTNFFPTHNFHVAELLEIDIKKGKRKLAPFVAPRINGEIMEREGFTTHSLRTPKIAPERPMTIDDIVKRGFGENIYSTKTPEERAAELLASDMTDLEEAILRRIEWMARELLLNGKIQVVDSAKGVDVQIDYNFTNKAIVEKSWKENNSDPFKDLQEARKKVIQKTGTAPTICIMSSDVANDFLNNPKVKSLMDVRNFSLANISPTVQDSAVTFLGKLYQLNLEIYTYDEWFLDDDDEEQPMLPEGTCILLPPDLGSIEYGGVTIMENNSYQTYSSDIVPQIWTSSGSNIQMLRMTSRPLLRPYDVDSWFVLNIPGNDDDSDNTLQTDISQPTEDDDE